MAVNWSNPDSVSKFREFALSQGVDSSEVEGLIQKNTGAIAPVQTPPVETKTAELPGVDMQTGGVPDPQTPQMQKPPEIGAVDPLALPQEMPNPFAQLAQSTQPTQPTGLPQSPMTDMPVPQMKVDTAVPDPMQVPLPNNDGAMLDTDPVIGTMFGKRQRADRYSGGVNYGTDIIVPRGTKVSVPPGSWKVIEAFADAKAEGPGNKQGGINRGYGNSVLVENTENGKKMRMSHLTRGGVLVKPGQLIEGGTAVGYSGATGNTAGRTGQHLDLEYYDENGNLADVMKSPYAKYIRGK